MTAQDITELLKIRHKEDVFVEECKTGESGKDMQRFDGWVMRKSWAHPECIGYEVKVNRNDFLNDQKYRGYLPYCNRFYFVCPAGLIKPEELDDGIGLLYVATTGNMLFQKKRSKFRDIEIPQDIFRYILMCRIAVTKEHNYFNRETKKEYWENWLKDKKLDYEFGTRVGETIRKKIKNEIESVKSANEQLKKENASFTEVKKILEKLNMSEYLGHWNFQERLEERLNEISTGFSKEFKDNVNTLLRDLMTLKEKLK